MTSLSQLTSFCFLALVTNLGCSADKLNLPEPVESIMGTYESLQTNAPLPIKGQKITMSIKRVAADLVEVNMQAQLNNQVVDSLVYKKAKVILNIAQTSLSQGCVSQLILLASPNYNFTEELRTNCSEQNVITYSYVPSGRQTKVEVKFKSL